MADIEKISIGTTSYDVRDAKGLHNKALADSSIVEEGSGTASAPSNATTNTYNVILGKGAYVQHSSSRYSTIIGNGARFAYNNTASYYATVVGYNAVCTQNYSTAIGSSAYAYTYGTAVGYGALTSTYTYSTAIGANAKINANYGVSVGANATTKGSYDIAIGYNAQITSTSGYSIQLGYGTNANGGFQVRNWQLLDNNGIIPIERIPTDLVVTTTDPLPNPEYCSVGTTQMYLGPDTDEFQKSHMYTVVDDKNGHCVFIMDYDSSAFGNINSRKLINIVDKEKFYHKVTAISGLHGGKERNLTPLGMWNNRYVSLYYFPSDGTFQIGASYENKVETLYYDYTYSPKISRQVLLDDWGIELTSAYDSATKPTYDNANVGYIILSSQFAINNVSNPSYENRFETWARIDYEKMKAFFTNPIIISTRPYAPKTNDFVIMAWIANPAYDPVAGGAWQIMLRKDGETTQNCIDNPTTGLSYWTTDELKEAWGITDLPGKGLYNGRTYISNTSFSLVFNYGHKWVEASFDLKGVDGYSTTGNQVLKNVNGAIQWGIGGEGGGSSRNIGDIFYTTRTDTSLAGAVECNGGTYSTADYAGSGSIGELLASGKLPYVSLADYATQITNNGVCGVFGWDGTGTTAFRVPTLKDMFIECGQASELGDYIGAGLPNIAGNINVVSHNALANGAFSQTSSFSSKGWDGTAGGGKTYNFNASRSNSIYGNSTTVQPEAIKYRAMIQLFNSTTDEAVATVGTITAQVGENTTQISDLRNMSNITATGKETIVGWGMPDYSAGVSKTWNTDTTATTDCLVLCRSASNNTASDSLRFYIDGALIGDYVIANSGILMLTFFVSKGHTYKATGTRGSNMLIEYPLKGVN